MRIIARDYATEVPYEVAWDGCGMVDIKPPDKPGAVHGSTWMAPAFFDIQINGCDGYSFNAPDLQVDHVYHVVATCRRHGIAALLPTLVTNSADALLHGFRTLVAACEDPVLARAIPGFHLEGPYISPEDGPRGAHPFEHVRPPSHDEFQRFQEAAAGRIRLVTLAPEHEGALAFIERLVKDGVTVAIGHTAATPQRIRDAVLAGVSLSTHLGNGAHGVLPRHPNYIWEQLANDDLYASIITDGHHLPPSVVKCIVRVKSTSRTIVTCDASSLAGKPPGRYRHWGQDLEVLESGKIVVPGTPYLAGSGSFTDTCVSNLITFADTSLYHAINMAGAIPRRLFRLPPVEVMTGPGPILLFEWTRDQPIRVLNVIP